MRGKCKSIASENSRNKPWVEQGIRRKEINKNKNKSIRDMRKKADDRIKVAARGDVAKKDKEKKSSPDWDQPTIRMRSVLPRVGFVCEAGSSCWPSPFPPI